MERVEAKDPNAMYMDASVGIHGLTMFPLAGKPEPLVFYSLSPKDTIVMAANNTDEAEFIATEHHELTHIWLADFGRNIPQTSHRRSNDEPLTYADRQTAAAEEEAKRNAKVP